MDSLVVAMLLLVHNPFQWPRSERCSQESSELKDRYSLFCKLKSQLPLQTHAVLFSVSLVFSILSRISRCLNHAYSALAFRITMLLSHQDQDFDSL